MKLKIINKNNKRKVINEIADQLIKSKTIKNELNQLIKIKNKYG